MNNRKTAARALVALARNLEQLQAADEIGRSFTLHRPSVALLALLAPIAGDFPGAYMEHENIRWITFRIGATSVTVHLDAPLAVTWQRPADAVDALHERLAHENAVGVAVRVAAQADAPTAFDLALAGERQRIDTVDDADIGGEG